MLYSLVRAVHLLAIAAWLGGMFFTLFCLRPALASFDVPQRLTTMDRVLTRFVRVALVAASLAVLSGAWLLFSTASAARGAGIGMNMPLDWHAMVWLGVAMVLVLGYVRLRLLARLQQAVGRGDWTAGGAALDRIRAWVGVNLALGVAIVVVTRIGLGA